MSVQGWGEWSTYGTDFLRGKFFCEWTESRMMKERKEKNKKKRLLRYGEKEQTDI